MRAPQHPFHRVPGHHFANQEKGSIMAHDTLTSLTAANSTKTGRPVRQLPARQGRMPVDEKSGFDVDARVIMAMSLLRGVRIILETIPEASSHADELDAISEMVGQSLEHLGEAEAILLPSRAA